MRKIASFIVKRYPLFFIIFALLTAYCIYGIPKVQVEYDITTYLPANTDTARALEIMNDEFATYGTATVLIKNVTYEQADGIRAEVSALDGVKTAEFSDDIKHFKDGAAKLTVTFTGGSEDEKSVAAYDEAVKILDESGFDYAVPVPLVDNYADTLANEMVIIIAISAAVILIVLLFTSKSFAEVAAFPVVFVVSAVLNMGTNYWLGKISFVSNTVCIILQLALAIDYAIILCHRFTEEKDRSRGDKNTAMTNALAKAIPEIASSSLTTVSGLVALMFMQLGLGFDLGMVLAKSIVCSLVTVFFFMPGILLLLSKPMDKTRHRNLVPKIRFWSAGVLKLRYVAIAAFVVLFGVGAALGQKTEYCYSSNAIDTSRPSDTRIAQEQMQDIFGYDNMFAVLLPVDNVAAQRAVLDAVSSEDAVNSALGYAAIELADGLYLTDEVNYAEFGAFSQTGELQALMLFASYARDNGGTGGVSIAEYRAPLDKVFIYLAENADRFGLSGEQEQTVSALKATLDDARSQLMGKRYARLVFNINAPVESSETFALIERLTPKVKDICPDAIFAGASMSSYDLNSSFSSDNILISVLTVAFIYVILAVTFKSWSVPLALVLVIQGAIFVNFALPVITGKNVFFFTYLIVGAIQMGATIDYAILLTNRFDRAKRNAPRAAAVKQAVSEAFPTVLTSGTIMTVAAFLVGMLTSDPLISSMGMTLATGTLISVIFVMTVLPALLAVLDPFFEKTKLKRRLRARDIKMPNPSVPPEILE